MSLAVDNSDVENGMNEVIDFIAMIWNGLESFLNVLPPVVIGAIAFILFIAWVWNKVT